MCACASALETDRPGAASWTGFARARTLDRMSEVRVTGVLPEFLVPDVAATVAHYRDVLGFRPCSAYGDPPCFAIVDRAPGLGLHFKLVEGHPPTSNRAADPHAWDVYFEVEGVDVLAAELQASGAKVLRGPEVAPYGTKELEVEDLHGYVLCFGEDVGDPGDDQPA